MDKTDYKNWLIELLEDEEENVRKAPLNQAIYSIDDLYIYGGFDCNIRGIDHNFLKHDSVSWENIFSWGVIIIPEAKTYSSSSPLKLEELENIGYKKVDA